MSKAHIPFYPNISSWFFLYLFHNIPVLFDVDLVDNIQ